MGLLEIFHVFRASMCGKCLCKSMSVNSNTCTACVDTQCRLEDAVCKQLDLRVVVVCGNGLPACHTHVLNLLDYFLACTRLAFLACQC